MKVLDILKTNDRFIKNMREFKEAIIYHCKAKPTEPKWLEMAEKCNDCVVKCLLEKYKSISKDYSEFTIIELNFIEKIIEEGDKDEDNKETK